MKPRISGAAAAAILLAAGWARAQAQDAAPPGAPTPAQAPAAVPAVPAPPAPPPPPSPPAPAPAPTPAPHPVLQTRWETALYGFVEMDAMHDTTQSYGPASNNAMLARPGTYAGAHARTQFTASNSQIGLWIATPEVRRSRVVGRVEIDFFGTQPTDATEQTTFTTPALRMRLFCLEAQTPWVDVLAGQYHDLFGWGGAGFYPGSLAFLGVAGEIYHRNPQFRLSKIFAGRVVALELATALVRPVQRDSEAPDLQGGIRLAFQPWKGATAQGFGRPQAVPFSIGLSGVGRHFEVAEFLTTPADARKADGGGVAANVFLPIIPVRGPNDYGNALSLTAEFSIGSGISDLYTGLTGGALFPALPDPSGSMQPPPIYRPNIDGGIVTFDANGNLKTIDWRAFMVNLQYYLPIRQGSFWASATYSRLESANILSLTPEASRGGVFTRQDYVDGNLFVAATSGLQMGLSYQMTEQTFGDLPFGGPHPRTRNHRAELAYRFFF